MPNNEIQNPELRQVSLQQRRVRNLWRTLIVSVGLNLLMLAAIGSRFARRAEAVTSLAPSAGDHPSASQAIAKITTNVAGAPPAPIWGVVETDDYERYIANLRAVGCPEKTVRDIVVAELNEFYEKRFLQEFPATNGIAYWKPGDPLANLIDETQVARLQELAKEKRGFISALLGVDYSGDIELTSIQTKVFMERLLDFLTPEKRNAMEELERKYTAKMMNTFKDSARGDNESTKMLLAEKNEDVLKILSPQERFEYDVRRSDASMMLRIGLGDFEVTEEEFRAIFPAMQRFIADAGVASFRAMVSGEGDPREKTLAARRELLESLKSTLCEERFSELMGGTGWNLNEQ